ncbi:MAG: alpha-amylase/4-alpha-glucanotransferase domain-containing protein, partial [Terriglobales bacterium]
LDGHAARGLVYIPSASYPEMMQWAGSHTWRGFLTRYPEANLLHKTQQELSRRLEVGGGNARARTHLLAAECNDVYWHGWFGGLYSPHLRQVTFAHLLAADAAIEKQAPAARVRRFDLLCNGSEVVEMRTREIRVVVAPGDGGTVIELDALAAHANMINSIQRRPEAYHEEWKQRIAANPAKLPGGAAAPAAELAAELEYDRCAPNGARLWRRGAADEERYRVVKMRAGLLELAGGGIRRRLRLEDATLTCDISLPAAETGVQVEWVFNLLAPHAPDRGLLHEGKRLALDWRGELGPQTLALCDGWRRLHLALAAPGASHWTVAPRYSLSQSEAGVEALYQGSAVRAHWEGAEKEISVQVNIFPCSCHF